MQAPEGKGKSSGADSAGKPLRADARRNRDKLLAIAARAFAEAGVNTSLEAIAREAGLGIGTLYRHFPTREALIEATYRREVEALVEAAATLSRERSAEAALAEWMQRFVDYIATKRGMRDSLRLLSESKSPLFAQTSGLVPRALTGLIERAAAEGAIRTDADSADVMHALSSIYSASDGPDWRERSRRLVRLLMDGLRYGAPGAPKAR
ncbi:TetR/AcrR family transcriptional regulator [Mangrovicella endophytica]|uniref:TetR/AcrR family transcriptional regulator n=1 Tax=Mangrovicella endophytica TaxID=2066697 RepID=UPI000C9E0A92|nr:TetR/AcrR family transcriptional regulator [Mangrovicella endophytica]